MNTFQTPMLLANIRNAYFRVANEQFCLGIQAAEEQHQEPMTRLRALSAGEP